jgi:hypothetical protein
MCLTVFAPILKPKKRHITAKTGFGAVSPKITVGEADTTITHFSLHITHLKNTA